MIWTKKDDVMRESLYTLDVKNDVGRLNANCVVSASAATGELGIAGDAIVYDAIKGFDPLDKKMNEIKGVAKEKMRELADANRRRGGSGME
jgi:hypothetical protein